MEFEKKIPSYLLEKSNVVKMIVFTAVFALIFINIFSPFNSRQWIPEISEFRYFILSCVLVLSGVAVVAISRVIMYKRYSSEQRELSLKSYLLWVAAEIFSMSVVFSLFEILFFNDMRDIFVIMKISFRNTALVLLFPYCITWLYFSWCDKNQKLKTMEENAGRIETNENAVIVKPMINFYDNKGHLILSVKSEDFIYIKGADNYITVFYRNGMEIENILIRNTMKQVEPTLKEKGVVRCHRSYMVNKSYIKMFSKVKDGLVVKLEINPPMNIPVSKSYVKDVFELFSDSLT